MFAFFVNGSFKDFWLNRPGDVFFLATTKGLKWDPNQTTLLYFKEIDQVPEVFSFSEGLALTVGRKVINPETGSEEVEEVGVYEPEVYVLNGEMKISC